MCEERILAEGQSECIINYPVLKNGGILFVLTVQTGGEEQHEKSVGEEYIRGGGLVCKVLQLLWEDFGRI